MRHWENRRSCVCSSVMEVVSDDIFFFTFEMQEEKKVVAKEAEEAMLVKEMQTEIVRQILRQLATVRVEGKP